MNAVPSPRDRQRQIGVFELERLRRTDSLADPAVRARALCGEIAAVANVDRVSYLVTTTPNPQLIATSTTVALDARSREVVRLQSIAARVREQGTAVTSPAFDIDPQSRRPECLELFAMPIHGRDHHHRDRDSHEDNVQNDDTQDKHEDASDSNPSAVHAVIVMQRFMPQAVPLAEAITPIQPQIDAAAKVVLASWLSTSHRSERDTSRWWRRLSTGQRFAGLAFAAVIVGVLLSIPVPFRLAVEGRIEPATSRGVFAPASGTLVTLSVSDGELVQAGDPLAEINSPEIQLQYERLAGELASAETELATLRLNQSGTGRTANGRSGNDVSRGESSPAESRSRSARQMVLRSRIDSLREQATLIGDVKRSLAIESPVNGRVMMRDDQSDLLGQNVMQSQWLMQIVDPSGGYHAVLDLPDESFGYFSAATQTGEPVTATLRLRSSPDVEFLAELMSLANTVHWTERGEPAIEVTMRVTDSMSSENMPAETMPADLHVGATVVGVVHAGNRAVGFVLFRPLIEWVRSYGW
ncbi:biotin/lipoyl-binding protein [Rhodopirellula sp. SWK7]|uniref:biotin/lipoyl-binding protein n=1 Tax=Rhodopirellula sp. SWK7 TaxID=595460 RepID=UPI0002BDCFB3|nr:HlyD family efflux transporter periplasmic adaptor subunit [Rhodopirellula sp. SWK7]EMI46141.1 alkaline protease secretion protein AprE [Rhodopirellula sp. SWK7]